MDNLVYQRDNVEEACTALRIPSSKSPRLSSMVRSATLTFWQPPAIARLVEISGMPFIRGACLGDSMGLGKTWEAISFMLKVSISVPYQRHLQTNLYRGRRITTARL